MKTTIHLTIFIIALAAATSWLPAAEPRGYTLDALVTEALARNPELKFYEGEIDAARGRRRDGRAELAGLRRRQSAARRNASTAATVRPATVRNTSAGASEKPHIVT